MNLNSQKERNGSGFQSTGKARVMKSTESKSQKRRWRNKFNEISNYVFKNYKCILFAIEITESDKDSGPIMLNPGTFNNRMLSKTKVKFEYYGYMIADNLEDANKIFSKTNDPRQLGNAEKYLNLGVITSHEEFMERNNSDRLIGDENALYDSSEEEDEEIDDENENELDVENLEGDWVHFCQLTQNPVKLEDIKFNTLKDSKLAKDHIIICGIVENMRGFVVPLRATHIKNISPIVIFNEEEPSQQLWSQLSRFPQIYFVRGSALRENDLDKINLEDAKLVVILSPMLNRKMQTDSHTSSKNEPSESKTLDDHDDSVLKEDNKDEDAIKEKKEKEEESLMDAKTIFKYNIIKKRNKKVRIITELYSHQNLAYLDDPSIYNVMNEYGYDQTPIFAAGEIYSSSLMDSLLLAKQEDLFINKNLMTFGKEFSKIKTSNLYQVKVPDHLIGLKFSKLFKEFSLERIMIPLGLYRSDKISKERNNSKYDEAAVKAQNKVVKYVVTNPDPDTVLRDSDYVFVLAHEDPDERRNDIEDTNAFMLKELEKNLKMEGHSSLITPANGLSINDQRKVDAINFYTKKTKSEFFEAVSNLQSRIQNIQDDIMQLHKQLNKKSTHMIKHVINEVSNTIEQVAREEKRFGDDKRTKSKFASED